ncbi:hypothetical protein QN277_018906 [Acacia crassicarpa]|uniref:Uncharacterized protein n=1 Tax=Acacia crassicarpa TaxID=499986 RepID=A0AAE1JVK1_9FABA|nr:hypothetical protein QN277_018906 [Acacia crassicarpa]
MKFPNSRNLETQFELHRGSSSSTTVDHRRPPCFRQLTLAPSFITINISTTVISGEQRRGGRESEISDSVTRREGETRGGRIWDHLHRLPFSSSFYILRHSPPPDLASVVSPPSSIIFHTNVAFFFDLLCSSELLAVDGFFLRGCGAGCSPGQRLCVKTLLNPKSFEESHLKS